MYHAAVCYLEVDIPDCGDKTNVSVIAFESIKLSFASIVTVMLCYATSSQS